MNNTHNRIVLSIFITLVIFLQCVVGESYRLEEFHSFLAPASSLTKKKLADYTKSQLQEMAARRDILGLLRLLVERNPGHKTNILVRNKELQVKKWADKLLNNLANIEASWMYDPEGENDPAVRLRLEEKAAAYLLIAEKKDRISRVWGAGAKAGQAVLDPLGTADFVSDCAQAEGLTANTIAIALVDADENEAEGIGFAQIGRPGKKGYLALTGVASHYPYEVNEDMIAAGKIPYTIYLKRDEVEIYRELGEQGQRALAAKLRQLLPEESAGAESVIKEREADVLMVKRLFKNKLIHCFLHIEDYTNDYRDLKKILLYGKELGFDNTLRSLDYQTDLTIMEMADQYCREKLKVRFAWVLKATFCGNNVLRDLLKKEIKRLEKKTVKKEALTNIYLLLRAVEICSRENKFKRDLNKMVAASLLAGPDLSVRTQGAATKKGKSSGS